MKAGPPTENLNGIPAFHATTAAEWRDWLEKNSATEKSVVLIFYNKGSSAACIDYEEAMLQALSYGWIDSFAKKRDAESFYLTFTPRKKHSKWSLKNKNRVALAIERGLITPAGQAAIDQAKASGAWDALNDAIAGLIPEDLQSLLDKNPVALAHFQAFPRSSRRLILEWIGAAKKPETRQRRIEQTVALAAENVRANHPKI